MKSKSSFEEAYSLILEEIMNGSLKPGEVVTEVFLAEKYGISRTPVREALNRFQCEGLICTSNRTKRIYSLSVHDIEEIFELKELIEGSVAQRAAANISKTQSTELSAIIGDMEKLSKISPQNETEEQDLLERWLTLDRKFHELIFRAAGNSRSQQYIEKLNVQWHRLKIGLIAIEGRISRAIHEHQVIAEAIICRDPENARLAMWSHLEDLKKVLLRLMNAFNYPSAN